MIQIMSRKELYEAVTANPNKLAVIMIIDPKEGQSLREGEAASQSRIESEKLIHLIKPLLGEHLILSFFDLEYVLPGFEKLATKDEIAEALKFAEGKEDLIVACAAGISRSSALAYVIARSTMFRSDAMAILNPARHWPNRHILRLGEELVKRPLENEIKMAGFDN